MRWLILLHLIRWVRASPWSPSVARPRDHHHHSASPRGRRDRAFDLQAPDRAQVHGEADLADLADLAGIAEVPHPQIEVRRSKRGLEPPPDGEGEKTIYCKPAVAFSWTHSVPMVQSNWCSRATGVPTVAHQELLSECC